MMTTNTKNAAGLTPFDDETYQSLCAELQQSRTLDDLTHHIAVIIKRLGFSDFLFARLERSWHAGSQQGMLSSFPTLCLQCYQESKLFEVDWLLAYGKANAEPIFSSQLHRYIDAAPVELPAILGNRQVFQLYKRYDFLDLYAVPMPARNGHGQVLLLLTCAGMDSKAFSTQVTSVSSMCRPLCKAIDSVSSQQFRSSFVHRCDRPPLLTSAQLNILRYMANEDCSIAALSEQLCISPITAYQHIAAARKALGTHTNVRAITKALKAGLISLH